MFLLFYTFKHLLASKLSYFLCSLKTLVISNFLSLTPMAPKKKMTPLILLGTMSVPIPTPRHTWSMHPINTPFCSRDLKLLCTQQI